MNFPAICILQLAFILFFTHCTDRENHPRHTDENTPALLDRSPKLQLGQEWTNVQNVYVKLRDAINGDPDDHDALINLALLYIQEARITGEHGHYYPAALHMLKCILEQNEINNDMKFRVLSTQAGVLLSLHQFEYALQVAQEAVELNPYNAQVFGVLVDAHVELGNYEEAVRMADKMVSIRPDLRSYARVSYLREIHGDLPGAIRAMEMAVAAGYPTYEETAWARLNLGNLYLAQGKYDLARAHYGEILQHRPNYPFALAALGKLAMEAGEYEQAEALIDEACDIIPEVGFFIDKAKILLQTDRKEPALTIIEEIKNMLADDEQSGHKMGLEYAYLYSELVGDQRQALIHAQKEFANRPKNIDVNKRMAAIYLKMNDRDKSREHVKRASRTHTQDKELKAIAEALSLNS